MGARANGALTALPRNPTILVLVLTTLGWIGVDRAHAPSIPTEADRTALKGSSGAKPDSTELSRERERLLKERRELESLSASTKPRGTYVVVDRGNNRIYLRRGDSILMEAAASTGSGAILKESVGEKRTWIFDTPSGRFPILSERESPVWTKPDWAFLEEGLPIPQRLSDRRDVGALGEYALDLGDGYMIHGTLYERLLGRSVTHGCIRVGREPLREIVAKTRVGTPVFIF